MFNTPTSIIGIAGVLIAIIACIAFIAGGKEKKGRCKKRPGVKPYGYDPDFDDWDTLPGDTFYDESFDR